MYTALRCRPQPSYRPLQAVARTPSLPRTHVSKRFYGTKHMFYFNKYVPKTGVPDKLPDLTPVDQRNHPKRYKARVARGLQKLFDTVTWETFRPVWLMTKADFKKRNIEKTKSIPPPVDNTQPRNGMTVEKFLKTIGRGCEEHIDKIPDWWSLFNWKSEKLKEVGIPIRQRKWILYWVERYRQGFDPYYIPLRSHAKKNSPAKLAWRAKLIEQAQPKKEAEAY